MSSVFIAQQAAEKYLRAPLEELSRTIPRTHILEDLINRLLPFHVHLGSLRKGMCFLTQFAVGTRYPARMRLNARPSLHSNGRQGFDA
jgi:HEPN domain-containing protein